MSQNPFAAPAPPGEGIKWADLQGALLLIEPQAVEKDIDTTFGKADAVRANVIALDGPNVGTRYDDTLIFPKLLQSNVRPHIGGKVLGRLGQGVAKSGQSAPWILEEATPEDQQTGIAYLNNQSASQFQQPAEQQAPQGQPAQQWQQQAGQQQPQQGGQVPF